MAQVAPDAGSGAKPMPADVSFQGVSPQTTAVEAAPSHRLPLGIGLAVAALASVGLWFGVVAGVRALFF
jgi:hypothetical protein